MLFKVGVGYVIDGGINMEWLILLVVLVVVGAVYYIRKSSNGSGKNEIDKIIPIDKGHVSIKGSSQGEFEISVQDENGNFKYKVKDGNIVGVKFPGNDKYYEYMG